MLQKTPLYQQHIAAGAKCVDFFGWEMPLHYGSQLEEHHFVRRDAGVFDVSHMTGVDITGADAEDYLRFILANDVGRLRTPGRALYSCLLTEAGGILDDLIVYYLAPEHYRIIFNSATRLRVLAWVKLQKKGFDVTTKACEGQAILAVQGPQAIAKVTQILPDCAEQINALRPFHSLQHNNWLIARTGYTGEDGVEIMLPASDAADFWEALLSKGVKPCGLGARDTLRLEAGLNLSGTDMDENTTPLESNLAWTIAWQPEDREFIGRWALQTEREGGVKKKLVGILLDGKGVLRDGQKIFFADGDEGEITSGGFSPTLGKGIGFARVPLPLSQACEVELRAGRRQAVQLVKVPFVRNGQTVFEPLVMQLKEDEEKK